MSFSLVVGSVKGALKKIAADKRYNKNEMDQQARSLAELASYREQFPDEGFIGRVIASMQESDFCKIVEVDDCVAGRFNSCTCTKVMVFGNDDVNGRVCEKFTTRATSSRCKDDNLALAGKCMASEAAGTCDAMLMDTQKVILENEMLRGKLKELYDIMELPMNF